MSSRKYVFILVMLGAVATICVAQTWDATKDFGSSNPNGAWSYGSGSAGTSFRLYPFYYVTCGRVWGVDGVVCWRNAEAHVEPFVGFNTTGDWLNFWTIVCPPDVLYLHPGSSDDRDTIVRWTAPVAGLYKISGFFEILDIYPTGIIGLVFRNNTPVFRGELLGPPAQFPDDVGGREDFSFGAFLEAGDVITFAVNRDGNFYYDSTGFNATITKVLSPSPCLACSN